MIEVNIKQIKKPNGVTYCANCNFRNNPYVFSYYSIAHETRRGFIERIKKSIKHEFHVKPTIK